jgi:hypothetical protein
VGGGGGGSGGRAPRFFLQLHGAFGAAYLSGEMTTDIDQSTPPGAVGSDGQECPRDSPSNCTFPDGVGDTVNITSTGFTPTIAVRVTAGYYVIERLAIAAGIRLQPSAGKGSLSNLFIFGRLQYLLTPPVAMGVHAAVYLGTGVGQIQPKPDLMGGSGDRYIISGLNSVFVGASIGYRFTPNVGVFIEPEVDVLFPTTLLNIDISAGIGIYF